MVKKNSTVWTNRASIPLDSSLVPRLSRPRPHTGNRKREKNTYVPLLPLCVCGGHYSGTPLLWTPWGPGKVSCIERCPYFRGKFLLRKLTGLGGNVNIGKDSTVEPLYCGHLGGPGKVSCIEECPHFRGKFLLRKHIWDTAKCP